MLAPHPEALTMADAETRRKAWEAGRVRWRADHPIKARDDVVTVRADAGAEPDERLAGRVAAGHQ